jgi:hypothetical protein
MTPEEREKLPAEAREFARKYIDYGPARMELGRELADELADWAERIQSEAVAERDAHWTKQEMGVASKCDEHCQQAIREALRNYARCPACLEADLDAREKRTE